MALTFLVRALKIYLYRTISHMEFHQLFSEICKLSYESVIILVYPTSQLLSPTGQPLLRMWQVTLPPRNQVYRQHSHTQVEVTLFLEGTGTYGTAMGPQPIEPGDMVFVASGEQHSIPSVGDSGLTLMNLHFEPRFLLESSHDTFTLENRNLCYVHNPQFPVRIPAAEAGPLRKLFLQIAEELQTQGPEYALCIRSLLKLLMIRLLRHHGYAAGPDSPPVPQFSGIMKAMAYMDNHLTDPLKLADLAAVAGISPNYFSTLFKRFCNMSPWEYLCARRTEKAISLILADSGDTMLEIALACGFNNTANFNKTFRKLTGVTPSTYRSTADVLP